MASSKDAAGSEPEKAKKKEAAGDPGKSFRFTFVSIH